MSAETQARPDLSGLDRETRINIAVAETQGYGWWNGHGRWRLGRTEGALPIGEVMNGVFALRPAEDGGPLNFGLPNYARDPAAWGSLVEKEGVWPKAVVSGGTLPQVVGWRGQYVRSSLSEDAAPSTITVPNHFRQWYDTPGEAVALTVLAKYGVEIP